MDQPTPPDEILELLRECETSLRELRHRGQLTSDALEVFLRFSARVRTEMDRRRGDRRQTARARVGDWEGVHGHWLGESLPPAAEEDDVGRIPGDDERPGDRGGSGPAPDAVILWMRGDWRCEYVSGPQSAAGSLRLLIGREVIIEQQPASLENRDFVATQWLRVWEEISEAGGARPGGWPAAVERRRGAADRRRVRRGGRREADPG
jgi:hypothetical protein